MSIIKDLVYFFINSILNRIPSRNVRMIFYYFLSNGKISISSKIGFGVKFLDIRNISIGDHTNINWGSVIDGRGGKILIGSNVDIAPQVNIWTLEHEPDDAFFQSRFKSVFIHENVWIANRAIILPGVSIGKFAVVASGSVVKGEIPENTIVAGVPARKIGVRNVFVSYKLAPLRRFR